METPVERRRLKGVHETDTAGRRTPPVSRSASAADPQLLLLDADTVAELRGHVARLIDQVPGSPPGGLGDLAATAQRGLADRPVRAGVVAASAAQARERLTMLADTLPGRTTPTFDVANGVFAGRAGSRPAIGYLFPGQGARVGTDASALTRRFDAARELYRTVSTPTADDPAGIGTDEQRIVASSVAGLRVLSMLGIEASVAAGHSLGELTALHWAGALSASALLDLVGAQGRIMTDTYDGKGAMARIAAPADHVEPLLRGEPVVVAGYNTPTQTVVAGPADAVARVRRAAGAVGLKAHHIPVPDAQHSPAMAPAAAPLRAHLAGVTFGPLDRSVLSTVTGDVLPPGTDLRELLVMQLCEPVRFSQVVGRMAGGIDLLVEVGPDQLLSRLAAQMCPGVPVVPLDTESLSVSGVLGAAAAAYVLGAPVRHDRLVSSGS